MVTKSLIVFSSRDKIKVNEIVQSLFNQTIFSSQNKHFVLQPRHTKNISFHFFENQNIEQTSQEFNTMGVEPHALSPIIGEREITVQT